MSKTVEYIANPFDVLFFRGNKSFHFGAWYSEGVFPPLPSTFQGFVRTSMLDVQGLLSPTGLATDQNTVQAAIGSDTELRHSIIGPFLYSPRTCDLYFRTPRDLYQSDLLYKSVLDHATTPVESDLQFSFRVGWMPAGKLEKFLPPEFMSLSELLVYRRSLSVSVSPKENLVFTEDRVGIGLNTNPASETQRSVRSGMFYVTPYSRVPEAIGLYFSVEYPTANDKEIEKLTMKLGSECHLAHIRKLRSLSGDHKAQTILEENLSVSRTELINSIMETGTFRLLLIQPGVFEHGWMPFACKHSSSELVLTVGSTELGLLSACLGEPLTISGYSYRTNNPTSSSKQEEVKLKPHVRAVPAGSVYLFRLRDKPSLDQVSDLVKSLDDQKIPYKPYSDMGFNHAILACGPTVQD